MSFNHNTIVDWSAMSAQTGGSGYRPPEQRSTRSFAGVGMGVAIIAVTLLIVGLALRPSGVAGPVASVEPSDLVTADSVTNSTDDGTFRLELTTPRSTYGPADAIQPVATLTYLGPDATIT